MTSEKIRLGLVAVTATLACFAVSVLLDRSFDDASSTGELAQRMSYAGLTPQLIQAQILSLEPLVDDA